MAFSMKQLKYNKNSKGILNPKIIFGWLSSLSNISESTRLSIHIYLANRLHLGNTIPLSLEDYKYMIKDLLKHCCAKEFVYITPQDTDNNIVEITFQLKWALERHIRDKRTLYKKTIYVDTDKEKQVYVNSKYKPPKRGKFTKMSETEIDEYFNNVRWL